MAAIKPDRPARPAIREAAALVKPSSCGGVDNLGMAATGPPQQVRAEVADVIRQAGGHPHHKRHECTLDVKRVQLASPRALAEAARGG